MPFCVIPVLGEVVVANKEALEVLKVALSVNVLDIESVDLHLAQVGS